MKKIISAFGGIVFACLLLTSCSNDELNIPEPSKGSLNLNMPEECKTVGIQHNEGLESAFIAIRKHYEQAKTRSNDTIHQLTKDQYFLIAKEGLKKFCKEKIGDYSIFDDEMTFEANVVTRSQGESENSKVLVFIEKIKRVLADEPKSSEQLVRKLNKINEEADQELSEIEATAVYAGTSTCYNSYVYWKENYMKWFLILNRPDLVERYSDEELNYFQLKNGKLIPPTYTRGWWDDAWSSVGETWDSTKKSVSDWWNYGGGKEVVGQDAGSAVEGAIGGAIAGSYGGGVGAVPGAIAGGIGAGAAGSIGAAISYWISK